MDKFLIQVLQVQLDKVMSKATQAKVIDKATTYLGATVAFIEGLHINWALVAQRDPAELMKLEQAVAALVAGYLFNKRIGK